jgi:hypothetical protein
MKSRTKKDTEKISKKSKKSKTEQMDEVKDKEIDPYAGETDTEKTQRLLDDIIEDLRSTGNLHRVIGG